MPKVWIATIKRAKVSSSRPEGFLDRKVLLLTCSMPSYLCPPQHDFVATKRLEMSSQAMAIGDRTIAAMQQSWTMRQQLRRIHASAGRINKHAASQMQKMGASSQEISQLRQLCRFFALKEPRTGASGCWYTVPNSYTTAPGITGCRVSRVSCRRAYNSSALLLMLRQTDAHPRGHPSAAPIHIFVNAMHV